MLSFHKLVEMPTVLLLRTVLVSVVLMASSKIGKEFVS